MYLDFSEEERKKDIKFRDKHWKKCRSNVSYEVQRCSGIGWGTTIYCNKCKKSKNITDVSVW